MRIPSKSDEVIKSHFVKTETTHLDLLLTCREKQKIHRPNSQVLSCRIKHGRAVFGSEQIQARRDQTGRFRRLPAIGQDLSTCSLLACAQDNPSLTLSAHAYGCQSAFWREEAGLIVTPPPCAFLPEGTHERRSKWPAMFASVTNVCMRNRLAR